MPPRRQDDELLLTLESFSAKSRHKRPPLSASFSASSIPFHSLFSAKVFPKELEDERSHADPTRFFAMMAAYSLASGCLCSWSLARRISRRARRIPRQCSLCQCSSALSARSRARRVLRHGLPQDLEDALRAYRARRRRRHHSKLLSMGDYEKECRTKNQTLSLCVVHSLDLLPRIHIGSLQIVPFEGLDARGWTRVLAVRRRPPLPRDVLKAILHGDTPPLPERKARLRHAGLTALRAFWRKVRCPLEVARGAG